MSADEPGTEPEPQPGWRRAGRDVVFVAVLVVAVVLGAAAVTGVLPEPLQRLVFHTPLAIAVLLVGTGWVLFRVARPGR
jgi:hypothetical protein